VLTGEDVINIILVYPNHSSRFFTEIKIGLSGNDPIVQVVVYQLEVLNKGHFYYMMSGGQTLSVDVDLHQPILNAPYVTLQGTDVREFSMKYPCYDFVIYNVW
jgi:hypothetical protein